MRFENVETISCDVLVIGGGGASLRAAIKAREMGADVIIASKSRVGYGNNTYIAAGNMAASGLGDEKDNHEVHLKDTVTGGRFLNDQKLVDLMARNAGAQVRFLERCGVDFVKKDGMLSLRHTPGHQYRRHVGVTRRLGSAMILPLRKYAEKVGVRFIEHLFITKLYANNQQITAATGITMDNRFIVLKAKCIILGTGGFAHIYQRTNNAAGITGDGLALSLNLGLPLKDMEFIQFYPTALADSQARTILYEAIVARFGAVLKNSLKENIIEKYGMKTPVEMTRDRVTQAVMQEILAGRTVEGGVILDLSPIQDVSRLKPVLPASWTEEQKEFIVLPTTHFCMGGIVINEETETACSGLFAAGEVCAGVHGANRLGGNALTEIFALGEVAGHRAAEQALNMEFLDHYQEEINNEMDRLESFSTKPGPTQKELRNLLKEVMWYKAGIIRSGESIEQALARIKELQSLSSDVSAQNPVQIMKLLELQNMMQLSEIICRSALLRTESRGSHFRLDYPEENNKDWLKNIVVRKEGENIFLDTVDVDLQPVTMD